MGDSIGKNFGWQSERGEGTLKDEGEVFVALCSVHRFHVCGKVCKSTRGSTGLQRGVAPAKAITACHLKPRVDNLPVGQILKEPYRSRPSMCALSNRGSGPEVAR